MAKSPHLFARILCLICAFTLFCNLSITAFAVENAEELATEAEPIDTDSAETEEPADPQGDIPDEMWDNTVLDALAYLGYKVDQQKADGKLYDIKCTTQLTAGYEYRSNVRYPTRPIDTASGVEVTTDGLPNVTFFRQQGLVCASFTAYYYFNYLVNVENNDGKFAEDFAYALKNNGHYSNYASAPAWYYSLQYLIDNKYTYSGQMIQKFGKDQREEALAAMDIGDLIIFTSNGSSGSKANHVAIYIGEYNGEHWIADSVGGSTGTYGPGLDRLSVFENYYVGTKGGIPIYYHLPDDVKVPEQFASIAINKTDVDGKGLAGAYFLLENIDSGETFVVGPTNSNGYIYKDRLSLGTYTVTETKFPDNYTAHGETEWTVTLTSEQKNITIDVINELKKGTISVLKHDEAGQPLSGVSFGIYSDKNCTSLLEAIVTGTDGTAVSSDLDCTKTYYVKETAAKDNSYVIDSTVYPVTVAAETTTWANKGNAIVNLQKYWAITVSKKDNTNGGLSAGDASIIGAVYGLYDGNGKLLEELTVDQKGKFTSSYHLTGTGYYLQEIKAPTGYTLDTTKYLLDEYTGASKLTLHETEMEMIIEEQAIVGTVSLQKFTEVPTNPNVFNIPEEGAEFQIYLKSAGSYNGAVKSGDDRTYDSGTVDAAGNLIWSNGTSKSKDLVYGTYIVHQTKGWENRIFSEDFEVVISEHHSHQQFKLNNAYYRAEITVTKVDAESGKPITGSTASFSLKNTETGELVSYVKPGSGETVTEFTSANGVLTFPMEIPYGTYLLYETKAPNGYLKSDETISFTINEKNNGNLTYTFENEPLYGIIEVHKTGLQFTTVNTEEGDYGKVKTPVFEEAYLAGVKFEITAAQDIVTGDGTIHHKAGDVIQTITTTAKGSITTKNLHPGKYYITEISAPDGYVFDGTPFEITVTNEGLAKVQTNVFELKNDRTSTEIQLLKEAEAWTTKTDSQTGETTREIENVPGSAFVFGIYADANFTAKDGKLIYKNDLVAVVTTDKDGKITFTESLPFGKYYVKELAAPEEHFILETTKYPVDLFVGAEAVEKLTVLVNDGNAILNTFPRFSVTLSKTDLTTSEPVAGALVTIKNESGAVLYSVLTNKEGVLPNISLEPGKYTFEETIAPDGYVRNTEIFEFTVNEDGTVTGTTSFTNEKTKVTITKIDAQNQQPLAGAVLEIRNAAGEVVYTGITGEYGTVTVIGLLVGESYTITEKKAPDGYAVSGTLHRFVINEDGTVSGTVIIEDQVTKLTILKINERKELLPGAEFTLYDSEGKVIAIATTGEDGKVEFSGFPEGSYKIVETKVPEGYVDQKLEFTFVNDGAWNNDADYANRTIENKAKPSTPQTGDSTSTFVTIAIMIISLTGLISIAVVLGHKQKLHYMRKSEK